MKNKTFQTFQERAKKFDTELAKLCKKHQVGLTVSLSPNNLVSKLLKWIIKVRWVVVIRDAIK